VSTAVQSGKLIEDIQYFAAEQICHRHGGGSEICRGHHSAGRLAGRNRWLEGISRAQ